jgi:uncharacterized membrane protein YbhN (UPF0104 family)
VRERASRILRPALLLLALAFCLAGIVVKGPAAAAALSRMRPLPIAAAGLAAAAGAACMMQSWRAVLADLGSRLQFLAGARVLFVAQLAKYVPGVVWAMAAQVELGREYQVPRRRSASAAAISLAVALAVGLLMAAAALPFASASAARQYWWALAAVPLIVIALLPPVLSGALNTALALFRLQPLERRPSARGLLAAASWAGLGWLLWGCHAWLLVSALTGRGLSDFPLAAGSYALAWSVGILVIVFPGGLGPRELALIAALAPVLQRADALVVALVSRVLMTVSDLGWAGLGLAWGRLGGRPVAAGAPPKHRQADGHRRPGRHRRSPAETEPVLTGSAT